MLGKMQGYENEKEMVQFLRYLVQLGGDGEGGRYINKEDVVFNDNNDVNVFLWRKDIIGYWI